MPPAQRASFHSVVPRRYFAQRPPHTPAWFPERAWILPAGLFQAGPLICLASILSRSDRKRSHGQGHPHGREILHHRAAKPLRELRPLDGTPPEWRPGRVGRRFPPALVTLASNAQASAIWLGCAVL